MRTILFRGKSAHCDAWCYGSFIEYEDERAICGFDVYREGNSDWMEEKIDYDTIGQYTGLRDIEGNAIYEGDILMVTQGAMVGFRGYVEWRVDFAEWELKSTRSQTAISQNIVKGYGMKIVSNIHDNPKFLEEIK